MILTLNRIAGVAVAALVAAGTLTPAAAQTWSTGQSWNDQQVRNDGWRGSERPLVSADVAYRPGYAGPRAYGSAYNDGPLIEAPVAGRGYEPGWPSAGPAWQAAPNQCFTDEGYGRFQPCDKGGQ